MGNIVITGGELNNKGAQAMTFIAVDEIKKRFPNENIYLASGVGKECDRRISEKFKFEIVDAAMMDLKGLACKNWFWKSLLSIRYGKDIFQSNLRDILENMDMMVDVSGYAIGEDWGVKNSLLTAFRGRLAKSFGAKVYYMPQSFGACCLGGIKELIFNRVLRKWLGSADIVYAREEEGYSYLRQKIGLDNVQKSCDLVLQNKGINLSNIYSQMPEIREFVIEKHSVGIVPNMKIMKYGNAERIMRIYRDVITEFIKKKYTIYLLYHSKEDLSICNSIKDDFRINEEVKVIQEELSYIEYCGVVRQLEFIIASRYHSIVNAYRESVPCIVLGWATKYKALSQIFSQDRFVYNVRMDAEDNDILGMLSEMMRYREKYANLISQKLQKIQADNVFDSMGRAI